MVRFIIGLFLEGLIAGAVLRALLPGEQDWSIGKTIGIGLAGWLVLGFILRVIFGAPSTVSRVHAAVVSTRVTGFPALGVNTSL